MKLETSRGLIELRQAQPADLDAYRSLRLEALQNHPEAFSSDYEVQLQQPRSFWEKRLQTLGDQDMLYFAEHQGELIGMCGVVRGNSPKTAHSGLIVSVYVRAAWRGLRIADELIERCVEWAREHGVNILRLGVEKNNTSAVRCYLRCGFIVYGVETQAILVDGRMYDELLMVRYLT